MKDSKKHNMTLYQSILRKGRYPHDQCHRHKVQCFQRAYQAFSTLKADPITDSMTISQTALLEKKDGKFSLQERFDTGINTTDDAWKGSLIGGLVGVFTGPLGMLFFGGMGALTGSAIDAHDAGVEISISEQVMSKMEDDGTYIITVADEANEEMYASRISRFAGETCRFDAAEVQGEIEHAQQVERDLKKQARQEMRAQRASEFKEKVEKARTDFQAKIDDLKGVTKNPRVEYSEVAKRNPDLLPVEEQIQMKQQQIDELTEKLEAAKKDLTNLDKRKRHLDRETIRTELEKRYSGN